MILGFKTQFPWGEPTHFVEKITKQPGYKPKIHTIRKGLRWAPGMKIHFATGVRTKNYNQFDLQICISVQAIGILPNPRTQQCTVVIDNHKILSELQKEKLALNDGFNSLDDFYKWFGKEGFTGQIIHWTDFKY